MAGPLRVGVVGLGRGLGLAKQFHALPDARVVAGCDQNPKRLPRAAEALGPDVKLLDSYEDMLKCDLDAVLVASGGPDHGAHGIMALESGRHVLSEVPAEVSLDQAHKLVAAVRKTGLKYMFAENTCYWGYVREYQRQVQAGRIGEVLYAECEYVHDTRTLAVSNPGLPPGTPFEEVLRHPDTRKTWRATLHPVNYLTHDLGPVLEILDDRCVSVVCMSTPPAIGEGFAPAAEAALFKTAKGRVIKFLMAKALPRPAHHWFVLMGTRGSIESPRGPASKHLLYAEGENMDGWSEMSWTSRNLQGPRQALASGHGGADWFITREFTDCILKDTPPPIDVYRAMDYTVPGICAVQSAAQGGAPVEIPDLREQS